MNLVKTMLLSLLISFPLVAMQDNDTKDMSSINDSTPTQTDWVTTTPSGNN